MFEANKIRVKLLLLLTAFIMPAVAVAQDVRLGAAWQSDDRHGICVDFRVNSTEIDPRYRNNAATLERIDSLFTTLSQDTLIEVVSIEFCGTASPEGPSTVNRRLSNARMHSLEKMVRNHHEISEDIIVRNDQYIAWDHLISLVENDPTLPMRDEVLTILRTDYPVAKDMSNRPLDGRIPELKKLNNGIVWKELNERYFVQMRNAWFIMVTVRKYPAQPEPEPQPEPQPEPEPQPTPEPEPEPQPEPEPIVPQRQPKYVSVKTNLIEVAGLIINLGGEVQLSKNLSFDVMGHYSPYDYFREDLKARVFAIQPELRYWFGEPMVKGHFVGLHVPVSGFNIQFGDHRFQDPNRALWGVGLSYGYAMPLKKGTNWGIEFTMGLGYMNILYDVYEGVHNGKYLRTEKKNYFGPTRVGIDISYRFDYTKKNKSKTLGEN